MSIEWNWEFYGEKPGQHFDDIEEVVWHEGKIVGQRSRAKKQRELPPDFDDRVAEALNFWAENHPNPDQTALLSGPNTYSVREIAEHVTKRTEFGLLQLEVTRHYAETIKTMTPEEVIQSMRGPASSEPDQ